MQENTYFQKALADFTHEAASGGAIRHLTDMGYTVKQIQEQLDYPTPYERVQKAVWEHLVDTGVILLEEPGSGRQKQKAVYVREYDKYGKSTFRKVVEGKENGSVIFWRERVIDRESDLTETLTALLRAKTKENGEERSYASFDFGLAARREPEQYQSMLSALDERCREYVSGLPWTGQRVYHRLNSRMLETLVQLYGARQYQGESYFLGTEEKLKIRLTKSKDTSIIGLKDSKEEYCHGSK